MADGVVRGAKTGPAGEESSFQADAFARFTPQYIEQSFTLFRTNVEEEVLSQADELSRNADLKQQLTDAFHGFLESKNLSVESLKRMTSAQRIALVDEFAQDRSNPLLGTVAEGGNSIVWEFTYDNAQEFGLFNAFGDFRFSYDPGNGQLSIAFDSESRSNMSANVSNFVTEMVNLAGEVINQTIRDGARAGMPVASWSDNFTDAAQQRLSQIFQEYVAYEGSVTENTPEALASLPRRKLPLVLSEDGSVQWAEGVQWRGVASL